MAALPVAGVTVIIPVLATPEMLPVAVYCRVLVPVPLAGEVIVSHGALLAAIQVRDDGVALTCTDPFEMEAGAAAVEGLSERDAGGVPGDW